MPVETRPMPRMVSTTASMISIRARSDSPLRRRRSGAVVSSMVVIGGPATDGELVMTHGPDRHARAMLPIADRPGPGLTTYDAKDLDIAFRRSSRCCRPRCAERPDRAAGRRGFGASSAFGGPCRTPTAERLAAAGLRYNRFHTTALCAPTRQALLTGRNHHSVGMGSITETATSAPATARCGRTRKHRWR